MSQICVLLFLCSSEYATESQRSWRRLGSKLKWQCCMHLQRKRRAPGCNRSSTAAGGTDLA